MMRPDRLTGIRACVFDAYGTLFDVNSATIPFLRELGEKAEALNRLWREKQLQYTWLRACQDMHADFWQVTGDALDFAVRSLGISDSALCQRLMQSYLALGAYPEVPAVLERLKGDGFRLAILSNGTPAMLRSALERTGLSHLFDAVFSVEQAGVFKPDRRVYALASDGLSLSPDQIAFVSSNSWDAYAASAFGMRVVWCNRAGQLSENLPGKPDFVIASLSELASCVSTEP
jgi:2-haloacid dehalogenase